MSRAFGRAALAAALWVAAACDEEPRAAKDAAAPRIEVEGDATTVPPLFDAGDAFVPPPFEAGAPVAPNPATNANSPPDAGEQADVAAPPPARDCLEVEPGASLRFEDQLTDAQTWLRIDEVELCPATRVTAKRVAYRPYVLCPSSEPRVLEIVMRGADMLEMPPRESVADAFVAIYADEARASDDPFDCLASSDDGIFGGFVSNSARIEGFALEAGATAVILASSAERPDQRGVGLFELEISAAD